MARASSPASAEIAQASCKPLEYRNDKGSLKPMRLVSYGEDSDKKATVPAMQGGSETERGREEEGEVEWPKKRQGEGKGGWVSPIFQVFRQFPLETFHLII